MTLEEKQNIIVALAIGDGYLCHRHDVEKAELELSQHIKHEDYMNYKVAMLESIGVPAYRNIKIVKGVEYIRISTNNNALNYYAFKEIYTDKTQYHTFSKDFIERLDEKALAILWMDDGYLEFHKKKHPNGEIFRYKRGDIGTHSFKLESQYNILEWLNKFGIKGRIDHDRGDSHIAFNRDNVNRLVEVVTPFIKEIPSMHYKIRENF